MKIEELKGLVKYMIHIPPQNQLENFLFETENGWENWTGIADELRLFFM